MLTGAHPPMAPGPSLEFMQDLWVRQIFCTTGHALLVYDYLLTLEDELCYIWNRPWTVVKVMFLINRYGNLLVQTFIRLEEAGLLSHNSRVFCQCFTLFTSCSMGLSAESIHIIVLMRTWAIWGTHKRVAHIIMWSYISYILVLMGTAMYGAVTDHFEFMHLDVTHICIATTPSYIWLICCGGFILDTVLFALTMRCLRIYSREFRSLYPCDLLHILARDAIIFFIVSMSTNAISTVSWTVYANSPKCFIAKAFAIPLVSVAGQRLVLNLRGAERRAYATRDLSREVDRQLEAFAAADCPCRDDVDHLESGPK
ncbi:hypothetical protein BD769DRAFT_1063537 [Suillus cothurnatus]|nr:hypothetical protein BD769DRAFT_1063537 [Suillus cothurnatus]